ncbi:MAG: M23 family metallopeptidase [Nitrosomonadales bacterium]|nr:M23 family metallopeptidase [Nitrosomonadales bacterium]
MMFPIADRFIPEGKGTPQIQTTTLGVFIILLCNPPALAAPPSLELPIRCSIGQDCYIQNYFDHDPGPGWNDYACGHLAYDGHTGTDFRLPDLVAMRHGVAVIAAADGIVAGLRDGEPDIPVLMRPGEPDTGTRAAGNGVRIDHGDGWETQYSHMRQGSIAVRAGQQVHAGERLGMVGLSGNTEFPHVDFSVRHHGHAVDPFAPSGLSACAAGSDSLWKPEILNTLRYMPTGILLAGWAGEAPDPNKARNGKYANPRADAAALVFWIEVFGVQAGDQQTLEMLDPQGRRMLLNESTLPGNKATWFSYAGKPRPPRGWMKGAYRAEYRLKRKGATVVTTARELKIP